MIYRTVIQSLLAIVLALLLLNVPPDTRGRIHEIDSTRLMEFRAWREKVLGIALGQRISGFRVEAEDADGWRTVAEGTTIVYKRILPVASVTARKVRVTITGALARPVLKDIALY